MKAIVAAVALNGVIGRDSVIPWHYPEDMEWFRFLTIGHTVIMGRKTFDSLPVRFKPLPKRNNIVLSRTVKPYEKPGLKFVPKLDSLPDTSFFIGGSEIYKLAISLIDTMFITHVPDEYEGDTFFPVWPLDNFGWTVAKSHGQTESGLKFLEYKRKVL